MRAQERDEPHGDDVTSLHPIGEPRHHREHLLLTLCPRQARVGHAAAFNRLPYFPDDAKVKLGFGFGIKSLIAIAPVDGQYKPADQFVPIENVNYLVFHGSHDGDVSAFSGLRQYQRVRFTDGKPWFKSAVYVYRANHGQWNTVWGAHDNGPRSARRLARHLHCREVRPQQLET